MQLHTTITITGCFFFCLLQFLLQEVMSSYHTRLSLHFLCDPREVSMYVRDVPWDCSAYVVCFHGHAIPSHCPPDKLFSGSGRGHKCLPAHLVNSTRCHGRIFSYIQYICRDNPGAKIPTPEMCHTYMDCGNVDRRVHASIAAEFMDYLLECPYPQLFSSDTGQCQDFGFVSCRQRPEPKAPCDYFQYLQLYDCPSRDCAQCKRHHPSCARLRDGLHPVPGQSSFYMSCKSGRTTSITQCPNGYSFSSVSKLCEKS